MNIHLTSVVILTALGPGAHAASIGINFGTERAEASLAPADSAGVVGQTNWNNAGTLAVLNSDDGTASGASLAWALDEEWSAGTGVTDPNATFLNGWISANNAADPEASVTITAIPYALYDLYVYMNHDRATEDVDLTGPFGTFCIHETDFNLDVAIAAPVTFLQRIATADGDPTQEGNYVRFHTTRGKLSGRSLTGAIAKIRSAAPPEMDLDCFDRTDS
jgi:hypothetical protein